MKKEALTKIQKFMMTLDHARPDLSFPAVLYDDAEDYLEVIFKYDIKTVFSRKVFYTQLSACIRKRLVF